MSASSEWRVKRFFGRSAYQDRLSRSWRIWGSFWAVLAGILALPEVQRSIDLALGHAAQELSPVIAALLGAIWPLISKARDGRPVRS